jgi:hypothetical protein
MVHSSSIRRSMFRRRADVIDAAIEGLEASAEEPDHFRRARVLLAERYPRRSEFEECLYEALHAYAEMPADEARKLKLLLRGRCDRRRLSRARSRLGRNAAPGILRRRQAETPPRPR